MGKGGKLHAPPAFTLEKDTWFPLYRKQGGPQGRSGRVRNISPPPGFGPRTVQLVGVAIRFIDVGTHLQNITLVWTPEQMANIV
jgi:hypothetical protein